MMQMQEVGKKIAARRKAKNMTQMALADAMGVSFQAVSNWERGHSMPDIAKLPELSSLLDLSIDDLLTDDKPAKLVQHILDGDEAAYIKEEKVSAETVADVAPLLTPGQTEAVTQTLLDNEAAPSLADLIPLAPFLSDTFLEEKIVQAADVEDISVLTALAPFLSDEAMDTLVAKVTRNDIPIDKLVALAPFLSDEAMDTLAEKLNGTFSAEDLLPLAPFLSDEALDKLARSVLASGASIGELAGLAPFLPEETLQALVEQHLRKHGPKGLEGILPYL